MRNLIGLYEADDLVGMEDFPNVTQALTAFVVQPAMVKGLGIPSRS